MFQSVSRHIQASQGKLSFINDVAENILNDPDFEEVIKNAIGPTILVKGQFSETRL